jgi:hypothetical protein
MVLPGDWADPSMAAFYAGVFENAIGKMAGRNIRGQQKARLRSRAHFM